MQNIASILLLATTTSALVAEPASRLQKREVSIVISDSGTPTTRGLNTCCIPSCTVQVYDFYNCMGVQEWSANCAENFDNPNGQQGIDGCDDGYTMEWKKNGDQTQIVLGEPGGTTATFNVHDCENAPITSQCVTSTGCQADLQH